MVESAGRAGSVSKLRPRNPLSNSHKQTVLTLHYGVHA
jgi:hypothetical protein